MIYIIFGLLNFYLLFMFSRITLGSVLGLKDVLSVQEWTKFSYFLYPLVLIKGKNPLDRSWKSLVKLNMIVDLFAIFFFLIAIFLIILRLSSEKFYENQIQFVLFDLIFLILLQLGTIQLVIYNLANIAINGDLLRLAIGLIAIINLIFTLLKVSQYNYEGIFAFGIYSNYLGGITLFLITFLISKSIKINQKLNEELALAFLVGLILGFQSSLLFFIVITIVSGIFLISINLLNTKQKNVEPLTLATFIAYAFFICLLLPDIF